MGWCVACGGVCSRRDTGTASDQDVSVFTYDPEADGASPPNQFLGDRRTLRSREGEETSGCHIV